MRRLELPRTAGAIQYVKQKPHPSFRRGGRQSLFVSVGGAAVQVASCGTHGAALSARATEATVNSVRKSNGAE